MYPSEGFGETRGRAVADLPCRLGDTSSGQQQSPRLTHSPRSYVVLGAAYAASTSLFDGACTYADYVSNLIWANFSYIMPFTITLIGGFIIDREYTDDTLKALFCVPVSWRKLIAAKLVVAWLAAIAFGAFSFLCSVALSLAWVHPADFTAAALLRGAGQVIGLNALQFLALAPIIALFARWRGKFFVGVLVAFCYGFVGIFVAGQNLADVYPPSAAFGIIGYTPIDGSGIVSYNPLVGAAVLVACLVVTMVIASCSFPDGGERARSGRQRAPRGRRAR